MKSLEQAIVSILKEKGPLTSVEIKQELEEELTTVALLEAIRELMKNKVVRKRMEMGGPTLFYLPEYD